MAPPSPSSSAEVVRSFLAAFADGDADIIASHVSDDYWNEHTSALGTDCRGRREYRRCLPEFLATFSELSYEVEDLVDAGDGRVAVSYRLRATWGRFPVDIRGAMLFWVSGGEIAHRMDCFDSLTFLRQVGQA